MTLLAEKFRGAGNPWTVDRPPGGCGSLSHRLTRWQDPKRHSQIEDWVPRTSRLSHESWAAESGLEGTLPPQLQEVEEAIRGSEKILQLKDDWDEEGSPGYKLETWQRAVDFVRVHCYKAWRISGKPVPAPIIFPGPDGSIDIHWRTGEFELLVNVPADSSNPATFYGDNYDDICIKGTVVISRENLGILQWLMR